MARESFRRVQSMIKAGSNASGNAAAFGALEAVLILLLVMTLALAFGYANAASEPGGTPRGLLSFVNWAHNEAGWGLQALALVAEPATRLFPSLAKPSGAAVGLGLFSAVLFVLAVLVHRVRAGYAIAASLGLSNTLRRQVHRQCFRLGQSALPTEGIGPLLDLFGAKIDRIRAGAAGDLALKSRDPILIIGLVLFAFAVSPIATLWLLGVSGLAAWVIDRLRREELAVMAHSDAESRLQRSLLEEDLSLVRTVRAFSLERLDQRRFEDHLDQLDEAEAKRLQAHPSWQLRSGLVVAIAVAIGLAGILIGITITRRLTLIEVLIAGGCLAAAIPLAGRWVLRRRDRDRIDATAREVFDYLAKRPELLQAVGAEFLPPLQEKIRCENITIASPAGRPLLDRVSVEFRAGVRNAVMGLEDESNYALVSLIPRLIDPQQGRVLFDGKDLRDVTLESLRAQVGVIFQNDMAFTDTVAMNIGLGDPSIPLARIIEAAKIARAHSFIRKLPQGYDTIIGPLGHQLSVDELYRIALARVYLYDPSIVILEEPTEKLSDEAKFMIDDAMARVELGRTLIFVPSRLSTIRSCQRVVVLHEGKVVGMGTHKELNATNKLYRHIQYIRFNPFSPGEVEPGHVA